MAESSDEGPPRSFPLTSLEELRSRSFFDSPHFAYNQASVPLLRGAATSREKRPRLLACHDLSGGYLDDQWVQGSPNAGAYSMKRWRLLDSFVYFSHCLVTLPPPGWTNAAHRHGVQVLGTFITEWSAGAAVCEELLDSEESARMYADSLAELAEALGFDGWLINIENAIAPGQVGNLIEFVRRLSTSMHSLVPESLVIWYDSVTMYGRLDWQNCLNEMNEPFFDACDGIFTNYVWQKDYPQRSATAARDRALDIYMGVDVFGRNTYGGGGFQCDAALKVARDAGVSAALFAPAWSYEIKQDQDRWWNTIENCWPAARPDPIQLPFYTDFDGGQGIARFLEGQKVSDLPWSNLSSQNLQPLLRVTEPTRHRFVASTSQDSACFGGGTRVEVVGDVDRDEISTVQLYCTDRIIEEVSLVVSYSVMTREDLSFCLALSVVDEKGAKSIIVLLDRTDASTSALAPTHHQLPHTSVEFVRGRRLSSAFEGDLFPDASASWDAREFHLKWGKHALLGVFGVCSRAADLPRRLIDLLRENEALLDGEARAPVDAMDTAETSSGSSSSSSGGMPVLEDASAERSPGPDARVSYVARLGHISIASGGHEHSTSAGLVFMGHRSSWLVAGGGDRYLSVTLRWGDEDHLGGLDPAIAAVRYHLFAAGDGPSPAASPPPTYLGVTMLEAFYVYRLPVPKETLALNFRLRMQCACGRVEPLRDAAAYSLRVPSLQSGHFVKTQPSLSDWLFRESQ